MIHIFSEGLLSNAHLKLKQKLISPRILNRFFSNLIGSVETNRHQASRSPPPPLPSPAPRLRTQVGDWKYQCGLLREGQEQLSHRSEQPVWGHIQHQIRRNFEDAKKIKE